MKRKLLLLILLVFSLLVVVAVGLSKVATKKSDDQTYIIRHEAVIKDIIWQHFDPNKQKIKSIQILEQTIKGKFDNGGDVGGDYDITFQATVNDSKNKVINVDINFPNAQIGPFTFKRPNPYKKKMDLAIKKDNFSMTVKDKGAKNNLSSWWNFVPEVWAENFSLDSVEKNSPAHKTIEKIYVTHRQAILAYLAKVNDVKPNEIIEEDLGQLAVTNTSKKQFELELNYLNKTDAIKESPMTFLLSKENLADPSLPIQGKLDSEKELQVFAPQNGKVETFQTIQTEIASYQKFKAIKAQRLNRTNQQAERAIFAKYKEKCREHVFQEITTGKKALDKKTTELTYQKVDYEDHYHFSIFYEAFDRPTKVSLGATYELRVKLKAENLKNTTLPIETTLIFHFNGQTYEGDASKITLS